MKDDSDIQDQFGLAAYRLEDITKLASSKKANPLTQKPPSLGERIAKVIAPQAVTLTSEHIVRMREEVYALRERVKSQAKEIKRLRRIIEQRASK
jgi:hypothetical protein